MAVKFGYIFIVFAVLLLSLGIYVFNMTMDDAELGNILINSILSVFDEIFFVIAGCYLIYLGYRIVGRSKNDFKLIKIGGQLSIFIFISLSFSILFNFFAQPRIDSTWRIFTFFLQAISRLFNPSFSAGFFIPIFGIASFIIVSVLFHKSLNSVDSISRL